jgi:peptidoglycan/xylan/chitin deacetylase (PgdA/CDA1 family)
MGWDCQLRCCTGGRLELRKIVNKLTYSILLFILPFMAIRAECQEVQIREKIISTFSGRIPREWGEKVKGVKTRLSTDQKVLALTFDACGGIKGSGYDDRLIEYLEREKIPGTLFMSGRWIDANRNAFRGLVKNPLFEIENHGLNHRPCSANGRSIYGIRGTKNVAELTDEIEQNGIKIQMLTGRKPKFYRPGTAYCDEIGVEVANVLGYEVVNFNVLGDAGATYSKDQIRKALFNAAPSSIIVMHMNHPERGARESLAEAVPELRKKGFRLVKLSAYDLR